MTPTLSLIKSKEDLPRIRNRNHLLDFSNKRLE